MSASPPVANPSKVAVLADLFASLKQSGRAALAPFVTAGDPDMETTLAVLESLDRAGASLCELGVFCPLRRLWVHLRGQLRRSTKNEEENTKCA
jgi:hypothetical protein